MQMIKAIYKAAKSVDASSGKTVDVSTLGKMVYVLEVSTNGYAVITTSKNPEETTLKVVPFGDLTIIHDALNTYGEPVPFLKSAADKNAYTAADTWKATEQGKAKMDIMPKKHTEQSEEANKRLNAIPTHDVKKYKLVEKNGSKYYVVE